MPAGAAGASDFGAGLFDVSGCVAELFAQIRRGIRAMASEGEQRHAGPWERAFGGPKGPGGWSGPKGPGGWSGPKGPGGWSGPKGAGHWGGGLFGARGGWWPGPPPFPPGPGRGPKASRGDVRAAILALLQEGPRNGYQIMSDIEERSGGAWRPSPGAVYPALSQLADEGLISADESGGKRTFSLTDAGRAYVAENPEMARGAWESTEQQEAWQVPGLFAAAARLGSGIVQLAHAGTAAQVAAAERLLERTRRELYRILADGADADEDEDEQETS